VDRTHSLEESRVSLASGEGGEDGLLTASGASGRFVASGVVLANVRQERRLDGALVGVTVSVLGGDVRDVGVRRVQRGSGLGNGMLPSISLRAGSASGDLASVVGGTGLGSAL